MLTLCTPLALDTGSASQQSWSAPPLECSTPFAGKDRNYAEAMHWFQLAADKGNDEAMNDIAIMYESGLGVTRNYDKSLYWRRLAAEKGNNAAMFGIGSMYVDRLGVKQDYAGGDALVSKSSGRGQRYCV